MGQAQYRLGFAAKIMGQPGLQLPGGRAGPAHLSVGIAHLHDVLGYLQRNKVSLYRMADLLPSQSDAFGQLEECYESLGLLAERAKAQGTRLTLHLALNSGLGAVDERLAASSLAAIEARCLLLQALDGDDPTRLGVLVAHVGGPADDPRTAERFVRRYQALSARARRRLVLENDGAGFSLGQLLQIHQQCGIALVFDMLHWSLHNPERLPLDLALGLALATWSADIRPKVHLSSPRSEAHRLATTNGQQQIVAPYRGQHADFIVAEDLRRLLSASRGLPGFDIMLEAKATDLALRRLREELVDLDSML